MDGILQVNGGFSYEGLGALFNYLEDLEKDTGIELALAYCNDEIVYGIEKELLAAAYAKKYMSLEEAEKILQDFFCNKGGDDE